jgi:hypothetical protein
VLIAVVRQGLLSEKVDTLESLLLAGRVLLVSLFFAIGFAGVSVGPSAATRRARWALFLAFLIIWLPDAVLAILFRGDALPVGPVNAAQELLGDVLGDVRPAGAAWEAMILFAYGALGFWVTMARVRREMIP